MDKNFKNETTLYSKIKRSNDEDQLIELVEKYGINKSLKSGTPLYYACTYNKNRLVMYLLEHGANVNALFDNNYTSLMSAVDEKNIDIVKMLLSSGADVDLKDKYGNPAIAKAVHGDFLEMVKLLVKAGADPFDDYGAGVTIYQDALDMGRDEIAAYFDTLKG